MKKNDVEIGAAYVAKVSGKLTRVRIAGISPHGGWNAVNVETGRAVRIRTAGRLRRPLSAKAAKAIAAADQHNARLRDERERSPDRMTASERAMAQSAAPAFAGTAGTTPLEALPDGGARDAAYDPDACATVGCDRPAALTYLGRPRCQECYADEVDDGDESIETPNHEENDMATKTKARKSTKKTSKAGKTAKATKPAAAAAKTGGAAEPAAERPGRTAAATQEPKPKRIGALDAAAEVLKQAGKPMRAGEMIVAMAEQGLWSSPAGKTPHATLYAAILREIGTKGSEARFRKVERGQFEYAG